MISDESNRDLAIRVAWMHFVAGHTQEKIANRLGLSKPRVNRLIAAAQRSGLIKVFVEGAPEACLRLGEQLRTRFDLVNVQVVPAEIPDHAGDGAHLASAGAAFLEAYLGSHEHAVVGFGHGRTMAAIVDRMPTMSRPDARFVSLLGSLTRRVSANPFDVVFRLTERTGAEGYVLPIPLVADSDADRDILLSQSGVRRILALARSVDLAVVGVGDLGDNGYWSITDILSSAERADLAARGAIGNLLGRFVDADGAAVEGQVVRRFLCVDPSEFDHAEILVVAGGPAKVAVLNACLKARLITQLITDESTASALLAETQEGE